MLGAAIAAGNTVGDPTYVRLQFNLILSVVQ